MARPRKYPDPEARQCNYCHETYVPKRRGRTSFYCSQYCQREAVRPDGAEVGRQTAAKRGDMMRGRGEGKAPYTKEAGERQHRVVAARFLGRALLPNEIVHHKNHTKKDNRPENLEALDNRGEHVREHLNEARLRRWK